MTTHQMSDLRPLLLRAVDVADALVHEISPADLDRSTPCGDFAVRDLLDHLVMVAQRLRVVLQGGHFTDVPQVSDLPDAALVPAWDERLVELRATLPDVDLAATVTAPFGTVPAGAALASYVGELAVHGWDLAAALGRTDLLDPTAAEPVLPAALQRLPREGRGPLPFGEVVDVPATPPRSTGWWGGWARALLAGRPARLSRTAWGRPGHLRA